MKRVGWWTALLALTMLAGCVSMQPPAASPVIDDPEAFLQGLVGHWDARWRAEHLEVEGVRVDDTVWLLRASPPDPSQPLPHNPAADTLARFWLSGGTLMGRDPGFAHDTASELCLISDNTWAPCVLPPSGWRVRFITADLIHVGEPDSPRAVLHRSTKGRVF